jgi:hypothetical protein
MKYILLYFVNLLKLKQNNQPVKTVLAKMIIITKQEKNKMIFKFFKIIQLRLEKEILKYNSII